MSEQRPRICPLPFSRTSLSTKTFSPCCEDWLVLEDILYQKGEDKWNGTTAQRLRAKILQGDFSSCKRELCQEPLLSIDDLTPNQLGHFLNAQTIEDIKKTRTKLTSGPSFITFGSSDNVCNLKCSSCRTELITQLTKKRKKAFYESFELLKKYRHGIEVIRLGDNGEIFFSPRMRRLFKVLTPKNFSKLREINILSNGTLLNEKMWRACSPGTDLIREINISIDAGNEHDYKIVRGHSWKNLLSNLEFISGLRRAKKIDRFFLNMTLQLHNYQGLVELIELASSLGADSVLAHPIHHWPELTRNEYLARAVHRADHPQHQEFLKAVKESVEFAQERELDLNCKLPAFS